MKKNYVVKGIMWFCSIKSHFVVIKIIKKVKKYKFYLCTLTSEHCCFYSWTEGPFSFDRSIYSFSIFLIAYSLYHCSICRSNLMQLVFTRPYEVGCSARWYFFNWASMSTIKIISWHPYSPMLLLCQYFLSVVACVEITLHPYHPPNLLPPKSMHLHLCNQSLDSVHMQACISWHFCGSYIEQNCSL